jgi:hypothetical protein
MMIVYYSGVARGAGSWGTRKLIEQIECDDFFC